MPFNQQLAERIRIALSRKRNIVEKKMFGGVGFMLNGNILVGAWKDFLIVRLGLEAYETALREPFVREFDITGKSMSGWVMVELDGVADVESVQDWVQRATKFVSKLPAK